MFFSFLHSFTNSTYNEKAIGERFYIHEKFEHSFFMLFPGSKYHREESNAWEYRLRNELFKITFSVLDFVHIGVYMVRMCCVSV